MSRILIEATPFEVIDRNTDLRHLYLVFEDDQGVETVITAAPDEDGPFDFGNIGVNAGGLLEDSDVARGNDSPGQRGSREIEVGGRDPAAVWAVMLQQAQNIDDASLDYQPLGDNSNTVVESVLGAVGSTSGTTCRTAWTRTRPWASATTWSSARRWSARRATTSWSAATRPTC